MPCEKKRKQTKNQLLSLFLIFNSWTSVNWSARRFAFNRTLCGLHEKNINAFWFYGSSTGGAAAEGGWSVFSSAHLQFKLLFSLANSPIYQFNQCFFKCVLHPRHARHWFQVVVDKMRRSAGRHCQKGTTPTCFHPPGLHASQDTGANVQLDVLSTTIWLKGDEREERASESYNDERLVECRTRRQQVKLFKCLQQSENVRTQLDDDDGGGNEATKHKGIHTETPRKWQTQAAAQAARENRPSRESMTEISEEIPATENMHNERRHDITKGKRHHDAQKKTMSARLEKRRRVSVAFLPRRGAENHL